MERERALAVARLEVRQLGLGVPGLPPLLRRGVDPDQGRAALERDPLAEPEQVRELSGQCGEVERTLDPALSVPRGRQRALRPERAERRFQIQAAHRPPFGRLGEVPGALDLFEPKVIALQARAGGVEPVEPGVA